MIRFKTALRFIFILLFFLTLKSKADATTIFYDVTDLGSNRWEYTYSIVNDTLSSPIEEFTIFFDYGLYDNLLITSSVAGWDEYSLNPELIFLSQFDGFYDVVSLATGISQGADKTGFSVSFDWLDAGSPGSQYFEIVNPADYSISDSGFTELNMLVASVPEPPTILVMSIALMMFVVVRGRYNIADIAHASSVMPECFYRASRMMTDV